jgi:hypothetical protein
MVDRLGRHYKRTAAACSVAIQGDVVVVGAPDDVSAYSYCGAA